MPNKEQLFRDVLDVLINAKKSAVKGDATSVKKWSSHIIHSASIYQDKFSISTAIAVHALGQILSFVRNKPAFHKRWDEHKLEILDYLDKLIKAARKGDEKTFMDNMESMLRVIADIDFNYSEYVGWVIERSKIKKGSEIYEHGISLGQTAKLLNVSAWDLMAYLGETKASDSRATVTKNVQIRMEYTKEIFGG